MRFKIIDLNVSYRKHKIIANLSCSFKNAKFVGVFGLSGSGKTTLLEVLTGNSRARITGKIEAYNNGKKLHELGPIGFVQQGSPIPPWLTVKNYFQLSRTSKNNLSTESLKKLLNEFGLESNSILELFPHELSGGMKARVALAAIAYSGVNTLFLDEPFAGIDEPNRLKLIELLINDPILSAKDMVFISHSLYDLICLCEKILVFIKPDNGVFEVVNGKRNGSLLAPQDRDVKKTCNKILSLLS